MMKEAGASSSVPHASTCFTRGKVNSKHSSEGVGGEGDGACG